MPFFDFEVRGFVWEDLCRAGQLGETATITESRNAPAIRFGNPDYEPYNHVAVGFQVTGSFDILRSSYSASFGFAVGPGELSVFTTVGTGINYSPSLGSVSASATMFFADKVEGNGSVNTSLTNLYGDSVGASATVGIATAGISNSKPNNSLLPSYGYSVKSVGFSTPGVSFKPIEYTKTKPIFELKRNP